MKPDAKPDVDAFDLARAEKRARWQLRRDELHLLREAKQAEREHDQLVIDKKRHEQEFVRRCQRERYLAAKPAPEPPEDILLLAANDRFEAVISLPRLEDSVYEMRDIVSRKKQVLPILSEMVEKYRSGSEGTRTRMFK